ncbi:MAG: hypothetical protein OEN23_08650 [Paracoccaceae bacterium]|nr:hypothetical protein [Paracoccaceae bacterium]
MVSVSAWPHSGHVILDCSVTSRNCVAIAPTPSSPKNRQKRQQHVISIEVSDRAGKPNRAQHDRREAAKRRDRRSTNTETLEPIAQINDLSETADLPTSGKRAQMPGVDALRTNICANENPGGNAPPGSIFSLAICPAQ